MTLFIYILTILYHACGMSREFYVKRDLGRGTDLYNTDRRYWHYFSAAGSGVLLLLLSTILFCDVQYNTAETIRYTLFFLLVRWLLYDNILNVLNGKSIFYVEKGNAIAEFVRWMAGGNETLTEILMIGLKLITLALIIVI